MDDERLQIFFDTLLYEEDAALEDLERKAREDHIPIIRRDMQYLLRFLLAEKKPRRILEVGTATGFSTLFMAKYTDAPIDTIENYPPRIEAAKANFKRYDNKNQITIYEGDAQTILPAIKENYDFIFMDAAKGQYEAFFPDVMAHLSGGGLLVTDNVLREGDILQSHYIIRRRNRTIHKRMRAYLRMLTEDERLVTDILPVGDGVALSLRTKE